MSVEPEARPDDDEADKSDAVIAPLHPSWSANPVASWLVEHTGTRIPLKQLMGELCLRLVDQGVALYRVNMGIRSTHPEVAAQTVIWRHGEEGLTLIDHGYGMQLSHEYQNSPVRLIHDGAGAFRRRLEGPDVVRDFPILDELIEQDCTDYVIMPILFSKGDISFISWTTQRPDGFTTGELTLLYDLLPLIALRVEVETAYENMGTLLSTYLGGEPSRRVLAGEFRRGQVESIRAAIWISDLRGFTRLSDRMPPRAVIALLDDYFDAVAQAVEAHGGEIMKFLGDGLLAIFSTGPTTEADCKNALSAAKDALIALKSTNEERTGEGQPEARSGIGLHVGDVQFGNIGSHDRLDFTVIGPAVNETARVEALCKVMERPLLMSSAFAEAVGRKDLYSLGFHVLRGVSEPQEIFVPAEITPGL